MEEEIRATTTIQYRLTFFFSVLSSPLCESSWAVRSVGRSMNDWRHLIYVVRSLLLLLHIYFLIWSMKLIYRVSLGQRWTPFILYANATISLSTFIDCMRLHKKWSRQKESSFIRCQIDRFSIRSQSVFQLHSFENCNFCRHSENTQCCEQDTNTHTSQIVDQTRRIIYHSQFHSAVKRVITSFTMERAILCAVAILHSLI